MAIRQEANWKAQLKKIWSGTNRTIFGLAIFGLGILTTFVVEEQFVRLKNPETWVAAADQFYFLVLLLGSALFLIVFIYSVVRYENQQVGGQLGDIAEKLNFDVWYQTAQAVKDGKEEDEYIKLVRAASKSIVISNVSSPEREEYLALGDAYDRTYEIISEKLLDHLTTGSEFKYERVSQIAHGNVIEVISLDQPFKDHLIETILIDTHKQIESKLSVDMVVMDEIRYPSTFSIIDEEYLVFHATQISNGNEKVLAEIYIRDTNQHLIPLFQNFVERCKNDTSSRRVKHGMLGAHSSPARIKSLLNDEIADAFFGEMQGIEQDFVRNPSYYDLLYKDEVSDVKMYVDFVKDCDRVLECGVGTGRVAIPIAESGKRVVGIDSSTEMVDSANKKGIEKGFSTGQYQARLADMLDLDYDSEFEAVVVSFGTINFLMNEQELEVCLHNLKRALGDGGRLLIEISTLKQYQKMIDAPDDHLMRETQEIPGWSEFSTDFHMFSVSCRTEFDETSNVIHQLRKFRLLDNSGIVRREVPLIWRNWLMSVDNVKKCLEKLGFTEIEAFGDYECTKNYRKDSTAAIVTARVGT